ncbi:hypothetical protein D3C80_1882870 [compost metagenome]
MIRIGSPVIFGTEKAVGGDQRFGKVVAGQSAGADGFHINFHLFTAEFSGCRTVFAEPVGHQLEILPQDEVKIFVAVYQGVVQIKNNLLRQILHNAHS